MLRGKKKKKGGGGLGECQESFVGDFDPHVPSNAMMIPFVSIMVVCVGVTRRICTAVEKFRWVTRLVDSGKPVLKRSAD